MHASKRVAAGGSRLLVRPPCLVAAVLVLAATSFEGATVHPSAWVLRAVAWAAIVWLWPADGLRLRPRELMAPAVAVTLVLAALPLAPNRGVAFQAVITVFTVVGLYLATSGDGGRHAPASLRAIALIAAAHAVWALVQRSSGVGRAMGGFFSPNDLAAFLAPVAVLVAARLECERRRVVAVALLVVIVLGVAASGSRSGLLALASGLTVLTAARHRGIALALGIAAVVAGLSVPSLRERWSTAHDAYAFTRVSIWRSSIDLGLASQPFGVGLNASADALRVHGVPVDGPVRYPRTANSAHSEPLNAFVELGWAGLAAALLPALWLAALVLERRQRPPDAEPLQRPAAIVAVGLAFAVPALVSASLHVLPVVLTAAVWAGLLATRAGEGPRVAVSGRRGRRLVAMLAVVLLVAALPGVLAHLTSLAASRARARGDLVAAASRAALAASLAPWQENLALARERLALEAGQPPVEVAARLVDLAGEHGSSPRPLELATAILRSQAPAEAGERGAAREIARLQAEAALRDPRNALAWVRLGRDLERAGDPEGARAAFERAVREEPRCTRALQGLAHHYRVLGRVDQADELDMRARAAAALAATADGVRAREILSPAASSRNMRALGATEP